MKQKFPRLALAKLCGWFGQSRQAYYKRLQQGFQEALEEELIIKEIKKIRTIHPMVGGLKLFVLLNSFLKSHGIKMGRDALFNLLSANYLLIKRRKRSVKTTNSMHWLRKYKNLIKDVEPSYINQLWVSDITYWRMKNGCHLYISLITDAYSRMIVGYHVAETLEAVETLKALKMALSNLPADKEWNLIHHSDRGLQYCSSEYVDTLRQRRIRISMTEDGDPLDNAIAERVNGILKGEYLELFDVESIEQATRLLAEKVMVYNTMRPHMSISNMTPSMVHMSPQNLNIKKTWKTYKRPIKSFVNQDQDYSNFVNLNQDLVEKV